MEKAIRQKKEKNTVGNCRLKCKEKVAEAKREEIHKSFWNMGNINDQRIFIIRHMSEVKTKYQKKLPDRKRSYNFLYNFSVNGNEVVVCKKFFMATLNVSSKIIFTATKKKSKEGFKAADKRGKHGHYGRAVDPQIKENIRNHIKSFPLIDSHFCRARTSKKYIDGSLNLSTMYRLYKDQCLSSNKPY